MRYDLYSIQCSLRLFGAGYMDAVGIWSLFHVMRSVVCITNWFDLICLICFPVQLTFIWGRLHGCCWYLICFPGHEICCMLTGYMDAVGIWYVFRLLNLKLSRNPLKVYYMRYDLYSIQCSLRLFGAGYMDAVGIWYVFLVMRYDLYSIQEPPEGVLHEICCMLTGYMRYDLYSMSWDLLYA